MFYEAPPDSWKDEDKAYIHRLMQNISDAVNGVNGIIIRDTVPDKPREGRIYYLREDLEDLATEGYYVFLNGAWNKLDTTLV